MNNRKMKKIILTFSIAFTSHLSFGQDFNKLAKYEFETTESYESEKTNVLLCANYLFNNPVNQEKLNRLTSIQYIMKWMEGTPEYTFTIDEKAMELTKDNIDLVSLYLAAMAKVCIEHRDGNLKNEEIYNMAEEMLVNYCSNPNNKIKPSKKIKKIMKERNN